jgi:hypothetical protein
MNTLKLTLGLVFAGIVAFAVAGGLPQTGPVDNAQASYVRICKDRRGMKDRRACGGKEDPRRTVLAFND